MSYAPGRKLRHSGRPSIDEVVDGFDDLPTIAPVAVQVLRLADDENSSIGDLVAVIKNDPALTARLLRVANSAAYGQVREVTDLQRAASLLGSQTVKLLSLGFSLVANQSDGPNVNRRIIRRSVAAAVLGQHFAAAAHPSSTGDVYVGGLLGNVGALALADWPAYVARLSGDVPWLSPDQDRELLGYTANEVTARIVESWHLPASLSQAIRWRCDPPSAGEFEALAGLLQVADAGARMLVSVEHDQAYAHEELILAGAGRLGLTSAGLEAIMTEAEPDLDSVARLFSMGEMLLVPVSEMMLRAQTSMARLSQTLATRLLEQSDQNGAGVAAAGAGGPGAGPGQSGGSMPAMPVGSSAATVESATDPITGLSTLLTFDAFLDNQLRPASGRRRSGSLGLLMLTVRSAENDGRLSDGVLAEIGERLSMTTRRMDLAARIGHDRFAVVVPGVGSDELTMTAERLRRALADEPAPAGDDEVPLAVAVGAVCFDPETIDIPDLRARLLAAAEHSLERSLRDAGRPALTHLSRPD